MPCPARPLLVGLLAGLMVLVAGCDSRFDPLNRSAGDYAIYGALNLFADTNHVRVRNLDAPFTADATRELDVTVTLTDENRGITRTLRDSVVKYENIYAHNFRTGMDIRPATQYRVTVRPEQGRDSVQATTTTPRIAEATARPAGMDCQTPIRLTLSPVQSLDDVDVTVGFRAGAGLEQTAVEVRKGAAPDEVEATFTPLEVLSTPRPCTPPDEGEPPPTWCHDLDTDQLVIRYTHFGPQSTESTTTDSVRIPGGIGSFRSYYRKRLPVAIDTANTCEPDCGCEGWPGLL